MLNSRIFANNRNAKFGLGIIDLLGFFARGHPKQKTLATHENVRVPAAGRLQIEGTTDEMLTIRPSSSYLSIYQLKNKCL